MYILILGIVSFTLWLLTIIGQWSGFSNGKRRAGRAQKNYDGAPSFLMISWFFLSVTGMIIGYLLLQTGN